ncbi:MAG: aldo/keto reductase [Treponema sp.]|nr:aldo/keto reductase [Treponema sp.]
MEYVALGKSNLLVSRTAFGAMRLEKVKDRDTALGMIKTAYDAGVNFFDTSTATPESERILGEGIASFRENVIIGTKSQAYSSEMISEDIDKSLRNLNVDYIDLYQIEKSTFLPDADGDDGVVEKLLNLKKAGVIRHFGVTTESIEVALSVLTSDVGWETVQFPFNILSSGETESLPHEYAESNVGFIAMRPLCGGLIDNVPLAIGYLRQFENIVPVWGVQNPEELNQILYFTQNPPEVDEKFLEECRIKRQFYN